MTRKFYEYLELIDIFQKYKVKIVYTSTNCAPFSGNILTEAMHGILIEEEGQSIIRRKRDADRKTPSKNSVI
ncbi:hypothetical protein AB990_17800 [Alkalihalobacillus pseudalcaliphilus]|nr:hypothetical protein AB990_17800 [Alkalihalobacillus pseudalcaliphilus]